METFLIFYLVHIVITVLIIRDIIKMDKLPKKPTTVLSTQAVKAENLSEDNSTYFMIALLLCWVPFIGLLISIMLWLEYRYYS